MRAVVHGRAPRLDPGIGKTKRLDPTPSHIQITIKSFIPKDRGPPSHTDWGMGSTQSPNHPQASHTPSHPLGTNALDEKCCCAAFAVMMSCGCAFSAHPSHAPLFRAPRCTPPQIAPRAHAPPELHRLRARQIVNVTLTRTLRCIVVSGRPKRLHTVRGRI